MPLQVKRSDKAMLEVHSSASRGADIDNAKKEAHGSIKQG